MRRTIWTFRRSCGGRRISASSVEAGGHSRGMLSGRTTHFTAVQVSWVVFGDPRLAPGDGLRSQVLYRLSCEA